MRKVRGGNERFFLRLTVNAPHHVQPFRENKVHLTRSTARVG